MTTPLITRLTVATALLSASLLLSAGTAAHALTENSDIKVSKSELKAKCARSGGDWKVEKNGVYRCVVHNDDSTTVVECKNSKCDGYIFPIDRKIKRQAGMVTGQFGTQMMTRQIRNAN